MGFFTYLIQQGYETEEARELVRRRNAYKETKADKAIIKQYAEHLKREREQERAEESDGL